MCITKLPSSVKLIPSITFDTCLLDNLTRQDISKLYTKYDVTKKKSCYFLDKFIHHIKKKFNISLIDYCEKYLIESWPRCPINNQQLGYSVSGKGIVISTFNATVNKHYSSKFRESCERLSIERKGSGNPMFGKASWNKGLDISNPIINSISNKLRGRKTSDITKQKQSLARANHPLKARHVTKHSKESISKMRESTARLWASGRYSKISSIHIKVREFLKTLELKSNLVEEYQVKYFSLDFAFPDIKIGIECQGTFFHVDPRVYPNGPICGIQRRNFGRDIAKKKFLCENNNWIIIELWETEINDGRFKDIILDKLIEYGII